MSPFGPRAVLQTPISALLLLLAEGDVEAVPVIETNRILGIVTKTDLLNAMARTSIAYAKQPAHI
tara:strand:- start:304 stop:498 length:195 start_codon:yes stop_codon:yes gene_type:complete